MAASFDAGSGAFGLSTAGLTVRLQAAAANVRGVTAANNGAALGSGSGSATRDPDRYDTLSDLRLLIFAAMAPPLGFVVAFWVMLQLANWLAGGPTTFDVAQIMMLPTIYLVGLIPALAAAWFDHVLAKRQVSHRITRTALFGY